MNLKITFRLSNRLLCLAVLSAITILMSSCRILPIRQGPPPVDYYSMVHIPTLIEERLLKPEDISNLEPEERNTIDIYYRHNRAVVNITSVILSPLWLFGPVPSEGTGSGVIVDAEGLVVTNFHVVKGAKQLIVTIFDGTSYEARTVGVDPENDLAVIGFTAPDYLSDTIPFGSSAELYVGQKVISLGNPFGLQRTLTTGVISGLIPELLEQGKVIRRWVAIVPIPLYPRLARHLGAPTDWGILVSEVEPGSPAAEVGLKGGYRDQYVNVAGIRVFLGGDVILSINGNPVPTFVDYLGALESSKPGQIVDVEVLRGSKRLSFRVVLTERPKNFPW